MSLSSLRTLGSPVKKNPSHCDRVSISRNQPRRTCNDVGNKVARSSKQKQNQQKSSELAAISSTSQESVQSEHIPDISVSHWRLCSDPRLPFKKQNHIFLLEGVLLGSRKKVSCHVSSRISRMLFRSKWYRPI